MELERLNPHKCSRDILSYILIFFNIILGVVLVFSKIQMHLKTTNIHFLLAEEITSVLYVVTGWGTALQICYMVGICFNVTMFCFMTVGVFQVAKRGCLVCFARGSITCQGGRKRTWKTARQSQRLFMSFCSVLGWFHL